MLHFLAQTTELRIVEPLLLQALYIIQELLDNIFFSCRNRNHFTIGHFYLTILKIFFDRKALLEEYIQATFLFIVLSCRLSDCPSKKYCINC